MKRVLISILAAGFLGLYCGYANAGSYTDNGNATVTDNTTGLMWQQCSAGLSGANCTAGIQAIYSWDDAITYCEGLSLGGFTDWRLPNVRELSSLVDVSRVNQSIDPLFPATQSALYWSSTINAGNTLYAWIVDFNSGRVYYNAVFNTNYIRCVRGQ
ncbi:MAG: DUF1566 domain-containing protein [Nitrospirota bacterium]|nr:DUF1566 domain-containing protein [Nitrospirota bacterium]